MKVGILGKGPVGDALAAAFTHTGHTVRIGGRAQFGEIAHFGELLVLAVPGAAAEAAVKGLGATAFAGKIVMDVTNPIAGEPPENGVVRVFTGPNDRWANVCRRCFPKRRSSKDSTASVKTSCFVPNFRAGRRRCFTAATTPAQRLRWPG
ncbi:MAG TPA: hypothetical protein VN690_11980 [Terriglobales bacterium]|nr:hypothetical protein [Terriglobales bacterium]